MINPVYLFTSASDLAKAVFLASLAALVCVGLAYLAKPQLLPQKGYCYYDQLEFRHIYLRLTGVHNYYYSYGETDRYGIWNRHNIEINAKEFVDKVEDGVFTREECYSYESGL